MYDDIVDGALVVDGGGKILAVDRWEKLRSKYEGKATIFDMGDRLILPGLIDMHVHLPQVTQVGKSGQTLLGWLERYIFPAEAKFADAGYAAKIARWFFEELPKNGTTLAVVFSTIHEQAADIAFETAAMKGNRVIMGKVMMDRNSPSNLSQSCTDSLDQSERICRRWHGHDDNRLLYAFTPRFAVSSTDELLQGTGKLWARYPGTYMHTHLAESKEEVDFVARQFPGSRSYLDVYERCGLTGKNTIFAHSIHIDDDDLKSLRQSNSSLAHCPSSNFFLKSGFFPYERVRAAGVLFGLGSDVAAGPEMCLFGVMKDANYMQSNIWLAPCELFFRATLAGAQALHLDQKIGSLQPGKEADFIVVNPLRKTSIAHNILKQPTDEILSTLVFMGDDRLVEATFVRGRCIYHVGRESL